jgi:hypothetical protein
MSEYQYYEFQALDRPLTREQMQEVRALSTRAVITPTSFVNVYHWGDFRGRPLAMMEAYYDAHLYLANWGTRELMLRFPRSVLDPAVAERYCLGDPSTAVVCDDVVILHFRSDEEESEWQGSGRGWLSRIVPVRADVAAGDHRALYLGWLFWAQLAWGNEELLEEDGDTPEPPVPPGLKTPTPGLKAFARFLRIDPDLIRAAAGRSAPLAAEPGSEELGAWIAALPEAEKTTLLLRALGGEAGLVHADLLRRFRLSRRGETAAEHGPRTLRELLAAADRRVEARRRAEAERAAREQARRQREEAELRARRLDALATREGEAWSQVEALVATRQPKRYDEAAALLRDLRDLALRDGRGDEVRERFQALRDRHARKETFLKRMDREMAKP